ncbi:MAG: 30S ribosomal protein S16 [Octadecabacter sp.]
MAMKIRLARGGSKKRPFYRIVAADSRMPRDGRYVEKLGTYNPLLAKDDESRVQMNMERVNYWLGEGAQPTDRISRFLEAAGVVEKKERANLKKGEPGKKAKERVEEKAAKVVAAAEAEVAAKEAAKEAEEAAKVAAAEAAAAPAEEAPAEEAPAEEAAATEATE